jgi:ribose transport system substrate-binding protein
MKKKSVLSLLLIMVMVMAAVAGCGKKSGTNTGTVTPGATTAPVATTAPTAVGTKQINVGFAIKTQDSPYFVALVNSVKELCQAEGWNITV